MKLLKFVSLCFALFAAVLLPSCQEDEDRLFGQQQPRLGQLELAFDNVVGMAPLELGRATPYQTANGDQFTVTTFRYYISNIKLTKADGTEFAQPESYYLIDEEIPSSKTFTIPNIPTGTYTKLTFTIGVDEARNTAGAQTGALAISDMFWSWSTGYIYTKLEGRSPQSPNGAIIFHIGGFITPNNTIRTVSPAMSNAIQVRDARTQQVRVKANILNMFTGPNTIRFATTNNVMGGAPAVLVANNQAAGMFTIDKITDR